MIYVFDEDYELDLQRYELRYAGKPVKLEPQVFNVLAYLIQHRDRVVTKEELLEQLWPARFVGEATLTSCVMAVRKAIGDRGREQRLIQTLHGRGYRFIAEVEERLSAPQRPLQDTPIPQTGSDATLVTLTAGGVARAVGRALELAQLHRWLQQALRGTRQVVFVTGEAGLGKTTLVEAFLEGIGAEGTLWIARGQCIEQYGAGEAYLPVLEAVGRLCRDPEGPEVLTLLARQAPTWVVQMPWLVDDTTLQTLQRRVLGATRERMLREMAEALAMVTSHRPLVLVLEDLHWSDASTLDLIALLARRPEPARLLLIGTYRPAEAMTPGHSLHALKQELQVHRQCEELLLPFLSEAAVAEYSATRFPEIVLPAGLIRLVYQRTDGNPLFMVNVMDDWLAQGILVAEDGRWTLRRELMELAVGVPDNLRQIIERQLDRLSPEEQHVLAVGSVAGVEFSAAAVAAGLGQEVVHIEACCESLARRGPFLQSRGEQSWPDGTVAGKYGFAHAVYQEVVYTRLPAARRVQLHRRIGEGEEAGYGAQAGEHAAELAVHFERGRDYPRAVAYLKAAADNALQRYANLEAISHLTKALALLKSLPDTPERNQQELDLLTALGPALVAIKGYGALEVEQTYTRARELCQQMGDALQLSQVLWGLLTFYLVRAEHQMARELGEQLLTLAQRQQDPALLRVGHFALGAALYCLGEFALAREHMEHSLALDDPQEDHSHPFLFGMDLGVFCRSWAAHALWHLGYPDQALTMSQAALTRARELLHPFSLALALGYAAILHQFRREERATYERAEAGMALCHEHGFAYYLTWGPILQGWVLAEQRQQEAGIAHMRDGLAAFRATGGEVRLPYYLTLLAEACGKAGQAADGLVLVADALALAEEKGERYGEAELHRLKGELLSQQRVATHGESSAPTEAEAHFHEALAIARRQQAKSWELRAAMSLSRLWQQQGERTEARQLLAGVYHWFTEGFDTADLQEAKALLDALA
jgi:predicted ATPase/DNA-binding winged helix-turn-helix (wHTH) protein